MTPPRSEGFVRMPDAEFEASLTSAAEEGAKRALADVGLDCDDAARSFNDNDLILPFLSLVLGLNAKNKITDPAKLFRLMVMVVDTKWVTMCADVMPSFARRQPIWIVR